MGNDDAPDLKDLLKRAQDLEGKREISAGELFPDEYVQEISEFSSWEEFCRASPLDLQVEGTLDDVEQQPLDEFVDRRTEFGNWEAMKQAAAREWGVRQLRNFEKGDK